MGKQKQRAAYMRGYRDSMEEQVQFLSDMERSLYAIQLDVETAPSISIDRIIDKINTVRSAIDEFKDEMYGGIDFSVEGDSGDRRRTIIDLQDDDNTFLEGLDDDLIDDKTIRFLDRRNIEFEDEDDE